MTHRILRRRRVEEKTGLGRSAIYEGIKEGWFPRQVPLGPSGKAVGWLEDEIDNWIASRVAQRDSAVGAA